MFTVNQYKIVFKRVWHEPREEVAPALKYFSDGRYDTVCEIYNMKDESVGPQFTGIAKLHPNDRPDKIVGKKIALRNAMSVRNMDISPIEKLGDMPKITYYPVYSKETRTAIWKAFWAWVADWNNQPVRDTKQTS